MYFFIDELTAIQNYDSSWWWLLTCIAFASPTINFFLSNHWFCSTRCLFTVTMQNKYFGSFDLKQVSAETTANLTQFVLPYLTSFMETCDCFAIYTINLLYEQCKNCRSYVVCALHICFFLRYGCILVAPAAAAAPPPPPSSEEEEEESVHGPVSWCGPTTQTKAFLFNSPVPTTFPNVYYTIHTEGF